MSEFKDFVYLPEAIPYSAYRSNLKASEIHQKDSDLLFNSPLFTNPAINDLFQTQGTAQKSGRKYRIYMPFKHKIDLEASPIAARIKALLVDFGYKNLNYTNGTVEDNRKNTQKIGRVLTKLINAEGTVHPKVKKEAATLLDVFSKDPSRGVSGITNYQIVISRHPYDVLGMSTDRHWTSCMNLETRPIHYKTKKREDEEGGINKDVLPFDLRYGTLIAYLIEKHDSNIERPLSRVNIKPYPKVTDVGNNEWSVDNATVLYFVSKDLYGLRVEGFEETINQWVDKHLNAAVTVGSYIAHKGLYQGLDPERIERFGQTEADDIAKTITSVTQIQAYIRNNYKDDIHLRNFCNSTYGKAILKAAYATTGKNSSSVELYLDSRDMFISGIGIYDIDIVGLSNLKLKFTHCFINKCNIIAPLHQTPEFYKCSILDSKIRIPAKERYRRADIMEELQAFNRVQDTTVELA